MRRGRKTSMRCDRRCCGSRGCTCATTHGPRMPSPRPFEARSKLKTWVIGILKHKIIDTFRTRRREEPLADGEDDGGLEDGIFKEDGHYRDWPREWSTPETQLSRNQFLEILEVCVQQLPPAQGRIFLMREWLELPTGEICNELSITTTNAGVLLHRARLRLRECLQLRWFHNGSS
jgi:RNA polymerase sigma-70 factor (ECF subfamily)